MWNNEFLWYANVHRHIKLIHCAHIYTYAHTHTHRWPEKTYDLLWSVELLEHIGRHKIHNYLPMLRRCGILFMTHSTVSWLAHIRTHILVCMPMHMHNLCACTVQYLVYCSKRSSGRVCSLEICSALVERHYLIDTDSTCLYVPPISFPLSDFIIYTQQHTVGRMAPRWGES